VTEVALWVAVVILLAVGVVGSILPVLPGTPVILLAALVYGVFTGFQSVSWSTLLLLTGIAALAQVIDWLASVYGARRRKASAWGIWGGVVGGLVGTFAGGLPGLVIGIFAGSCLAEWLLGRREIFQALGVGWGSLLGFLGGTLVKMMLAITMVGIFLYAAIG
jgi:uncharacterized protein YqgC (DUF456 family)